MAAVAADAGVAKGTTYLYFPTKEALFLALLTDELGAWVKALLPALTEGMGPGPAARAFAASLAKRPLLVRLLGHLHGTLEAGADAESLRAFKGSLVAALGHAAPRLEAALGPGAEGQGVRLFLHAHALVVGIAQMSDEPPRWPPSWTSPRSARCACVSARSSSGRWARCSRGWGDPGRRPGWSAGTKPGCRSARTGVAGEPRRAGRASSARPRRGSGVRLRS